MGWHRVTYRTLNLPVAAQEAEHLANVARERSNQRFAQYQAALRKRNAETEINEARRQWRATATKDDVASTD
ncbi:MAG: hypothetical protein ABI274_00675 [Ktedonobacterales bacterium]